MFSAEDYQNIQNATGMSEVHLAADEALQAEYLTQQRMYHAMGGTGALPPILLIPMLRSLGYEAAKRPEPSAKPVDWRNVKFGARVVVATESVAAFGEYCGIVYDGMLGVRFDGTASVEIFAPNFVSLAPVNSPSRPAAPQVPDLDDERFESSTRAENSKQFDPADPTGRDPGPEVDRKWLQSLPGDPVTVKFRGKLVAGQFIDEGPNDGQVTVFLGPDLGEVALGEDDVTVGHPEQELVAAAPAKKTAKAPAKRRTTKKKA
jgi:hypothetical protein